MNSRPPGREEILFPQTQGLSLLDRGVLRLLLGVIRLGQSLPYGLAQALGATLGGVAFVLCAPRTRVALQNLYQSLGRQRGWGWTLRTIFQMYQHFGRNLVDLFRLPLWVQGREPFPVEARGLEYLQGAWHQGRGVFILTAHLGHWEMLAAWTARQGFPLHVVARPIRNPALQSLARWFREQEGVSVIWKGDAGPSLVRRLRQGAVVGFVMDQRAGHGEGEVVRFLGRPMRAFRALALLALRYQVPVVPAYTWRDARGIHQIRFEPPIWCKGEGDLTRDVQRWTQHFMDVLEQVIRQHPEQWIWIHRGWAP